ncbi:MAG: lipid A export permease/ATP-binding protein MsbA [Gammaproteobacteria bacterium]|nr:MAG: lipid A export permease/ATP-binding protein MsbA [Gammaproteobacteria bacterium]
MSGSSSSLDDDQQNGFSLYRRLLTYVLPYRAGFLVSVIGMAIYAATDTGFAALMQPLLDGSFVDRDPASIRLIPVMLILLFLLRGIAGFAATYCMIWVGRNVVRDLRQQMFGKMLVLPVSFYEANATGQLLSKMSYDVEQVAQASTNAVTILIRDTLTVVGLVAWMVYLSWQLAVLVIVITPLVALIVRYVNKRFRRINQSIQDSMAGITQRTGEIIDCQRVVKLNGAQSFEEARFRRDNDKNRQQHMKIAATTSASAPILQLILAGVLALIVWVATSQIMSQQVTVGTFMSFMVAMMMMMAPIKRLTTINAALQRGIVAARSIFGLIDARPEQDEGTRKITRLKGDIRFEDVCFSYPGAAGTVLDHINLDIRAGESVALVGRSGSGKTTLVSLIPRFYFIEKGCLYIDHHPVQEYSLSCLRENIALVSQDISLFNASVRDNIAYGHEEVDEEAIVKALEAAHAWEFVQNLPQGMDTLIGEDGVLLSGGQRQRLAIARAFLKDAPILILDEATSALDTESERYIQESLEQLMWNRTTLVIAHRLSTIERVGRIVVMDKGRIIEVGTHQELMNRKGSYARMVNLQNRDGVLDIA